MRIGIDARFLGPQGTGLGRYTQELVQNLEKIDKKNEYVIFLRKENFDLYRPKSKNFKKVLADIPWYSLKEQLLLPWIFWRARLDFLHVPHFNIPIFYPGRMIVTVHDLIKSEWSGKAATTRLYPVYLAKHLGYRFVIDQAIKRSFAVLVPSKYVKEKVAESYAVDPKKIFVTYEAAVLAGSGRSDRERRAEDVIGRFAITKPYLLYVGNVYPYKNVERLLDAVKILNENIGKKVQLVVVGARDVFREKLEREVSRRGVSKYVILTGFVTDADLIDLYRQAEVYVHPSLTEGFGLGSIEAMSFGAPVVHSKAGPLPEVGGDAALYFDPYDPQDIAKKVGKVVGNASLRKKLIKKGFAQSGKYSWERMAQETLEVYEKAFKNA